MPVVSKWLALAAIALLLWVARGVLPPFVVAGVLAYVLSPVVDEFAWRLRVRRSIAALLVVVILLGLLALGMWLAGARLLDEVRSLAKEGPSIISTVVERITGGQDLEFLGQRVTPRQLSNRIDAAVADVLGSPGEALHAAQMAIELALSTLLAILALVYFLADGHRLGAFLLRFVPVEHRARTEWVAREVHAVLGRYLRGQLLLVGIMAAVTFTVLELVFRLPFALWIAILTGFLEIVPLVGPVIAGAIASSVGFAQGGPAEAGWIALTYLILRQVEDQLVMPQVVGRAVHLHPMFTIFAVLTGERVAGVLGMLLAVPFAAALKVVLDYAYPPVKPAEESGEANGPPPPSRVHPH